MPQTEVYLKDDPQWYKDAIIYELHIRAFYDSNADGIGDIQGALEKLDYLAKIKQLIGWDKEKEIAPRRGAS
jgi:maltose alpha-D-glucosyltransferase/alpha-amylase